MSTTYYLPIFSLFLLWTSASAPAQMADVRQTATGLMSIEEERKIGEREHALEIATRGVYDDVELAAYVNKVGAALQKKAPSAHFEPSYTITDFGFPAANTLPAGHIHIDRAFLAILSNEAELAALLAHEMGHVAARDWARGHSLGILDTCNVALSSAMNEPAIQRILHRSEYKADEYALQILLLTDYDPLALVTMLEALELGFRNLVSNGQLVTKENCLATHPPTEQRISRIKQIVKEVPVKNSHLRREAYLAKIDGVAWVPNLNLITNTDEYSDHEAYIEVVDIKPGDTFETLIRKPGMNTFLSGSHFQLLNRLEASAPLEVGTQIKLVR